MITALYVPVKFYAEFLKKAPNGNSYIIGSNGKKTKIPSWWVEAEVECPCCHCIGHFKINCYYTRDVVFYDTAEGAFQAEKLRIQDLKCKQCGSTHAVLPEDVIPYRSLTLISMLTAMRDFYVGTAELKDVEGTISVENKDGTPSGLYRKPRTHEGKLSAEMSLYLLFAYCKLVEKYLTASELVLRTLGYWTEEARLSMIDVVRVLNAKGIREFQLVYCKTQHTPYLFDHHRSDTGSPWTGWAKCYKM